MQITKHARHKRRRHNATRVKRGGMKLKMASRDDLREEQRNYQILFSPHMQSSMPLGLQFHHLLQAPPPNCDSVTDARNVLYHSTTDPSTLHKILQTYGGPQDGSKGYYDYCTSMRSWRSWSSNDNGCTTALMDGCKAETELKDLINQVIQTVEMSIELAQPQPQPQPRSLLKTVSSFFLGPEPEPPLQPKPPLRPMQLMETFKCDADNFSRKISKLYKKFYDTKDADGTRVYRSSGRFDASINSNLLELSNKINASMDVIKISLEVKLKMLEMARDIAVPNMIEAYHEDNEFEHQRLPGFLFREDPAEFTANVGAFKRHLDEAVAQLKYVMGGDHSIVATSRMLREISHLRPPNFYRTLTSSRLAPPSAAVGALIHDLSEFKVLPRALTSLTKNSAIAKLLTERLTTKPRNNSNINARHLIGFHKKDKPEDDLLLEYG